MGPGKRVRAVAVAAWLLAATVLSQDPDAEPAVRSAGTAVDRAGEPLAGVTVTLRSMAGGAAAPTLTTDRRGRWSSPPLPPGRYDIRLEKEGYLPSEGFVDVLPSRGSTIVVELRSLDEVSPAFAEGDPRGSVRGWIERANALLEQGRPAVARGEYQKALPHLRGEPRAEVLRAVARTHYLEGDVPATLEALVAALRAWPPGEENRVLYRTLMAELDRAAEAERVLAALEADPPEPAGEPDASRPSRRPPPEPVAAVAHRVGEQTVRFSERSPSSARAELLGRYRLPEPEILENDPDALAYDLAGESFDLLVPESYRAGEPWGLVVWISPTGRGGVADPAVRELLARHRLLWAGANEAGNPRAKWDRVGLALDAVFNLQRLYTIDRERIVVAGYSGGGRISAAAATLYPDVFGGGICWFGVDYHRPVPVPFKPGHSWPAGFPQPARNALRALQRETRLALVTGERDFNRAETAAVRRAMEEDGFSAVSYLEIPGADHYHGLDAEWLGKAIDFVLPAS
ncbi:MAG TPA: carboxypeptidase regulatory-like domain-containing protein [Thermoanaerobaculia bacterium]|nr:carboxypeptidase regulatory-like domain-containing protein [Thermoanaerobaculia bacterium]